MSLQRNNIKMNPSTHPQTYHVSWQQYGNNRRKCCHPRNALIHSAHNARAFILDVSFNRLGVVAWNVVSGRTHAKRNEWHDLLSILGTGASVSTYAASTKCQAVLSSRDATEIHRAQSFRKCRKKT